MMQGAEGIGEEIVTWRCDKNWKGRLRQTVKGRLQQQSAVEKASKLDGVLIGNYRLRASSEMIGCTS